MLWRSMTRSCWRNGQRTCSWLPFAAPACCFCCAGEEHFASLDTRVMWLHRVTALMPEWCGCTGWQPWCQSETAEQGDSCCVSWITRAKISPAGSSNWVVPTGARAQAWEEVCCSTVPDSGDLQCITVADVQHWMRRSTCRTRLFACSRRTSGMPKQLKVLGVIPYVEWEYQKGGWTRPG